VLLPEYHHRSSPRPWQCANGYRPSVSATRASYGLNVAFFYSKLYLRILRPQWNALLPESDHLPRPLRIALDQLDAEIQKLHEEAALAA
jgi:hypothetical protein